MLNIKELRLESVGSRVRSEIHKLLGHADPEVRAVAGLVLDRLRVEAPNLFGDYERAPLPGGGGIALL